MWHSLPISELSHSERYRIVRAAYHFYPLFEYEGMDVPFKRQIEEFIYPLQNSWEDGLLTVEMLVHVKILMPLIPFCVTLLLAIQD